MRERVTYIARDAAKVDPSQFQLSSKDFAVSQLDAVKEHQITLDKDELPAELWRVLRNCHELHVRWTTHRPYPALAPFVSRVPPGLHVTYTPLEGKSAKRLCQLIKDTFGGQGNIGGATGSTGIKCESVEEAFSTPNVLSERFASSAARQFYSFLPSLQNLSMWFQQHACGENVNCMLQAFGMQQADGFDLDFDAVSQTTSIKVVWSRANGESGWDETLTKGTKKTDTLEVGVLMNETPEEDEELRYSGWSTKVGQDKKPCTSQSNLNSSLTTS
jgi:hypothetical protein